jgi:stage V sporulation protein SpoVS
LRCSYGFATATFSASGAKVSAGAAAGAVTDTTTANIQPFGECTSMSNPAVNAATEEAQGFLTPQPCQPVITGNWTPGSAQVKVGPAAALTSDSQCTCAWGGAISVSDPGQESVTLT